MLMVGFTVIYPIDVSYSENKKAIVCHILNRKIM